MPSQPLDFDLARKHGLLPLLARQCGRLGVPVLGIAKEVALQSMLIEARTRAFVDLFAQGLLASDTLVIKGPAVGALYYDGIEDRPFTDFDVLVRREAVPALVSRLESAGFVGSIPRGPRGLDEFLEWRHELALSGPEELLVELHWSLSQRHFRLELKPDELTRLAQPVQLFGRSFQTLGAAHQLLYLCHHGAKHEWVRLLWLVDIERVLAKESEHLDWTAVLEEARRLETLRILLLGLRLAHAWLGSELPELVHRELEGDRRALDVLEREAARLVQPGQKASLSERYRFRWLLRNELRGRLRDAFWYSAFNAQPTFVERDMARLPEAAYYAIRPFRLGMRWVKKRRR